MAQSALARLKSKKISLSVSIGLAFSLSLIPILLFIISYSYRANSRSLYAMSESYAQKSGKDAIAAMDGLLEPVASTLRVGAQLAAADPSFFRADKSRDYLYQMLVSAEQIDAVYSSFEDGFHRVVTRVDADRRRHDPQIPAEARWHAGWIGPDGSGTRLRHRAFFAVWPRVIKTYSVPERNDVRATPQYTAAKATRALSMSEPAINTDTGGPVMSLSAPVLRGGKFIGAVSANITFDRIARYLAGHRPSPRGVTLVLDAAGQIVAQPDLTKGLRKADGKLILPRAADEPLAADALAERARLGADRFVFVSGDPAAEYIAAFTPFPGTFGKKWDVLTVTPTDDFLGALKRANEKLLLIMTLLLFLELLLIFAVSKRIADPINRLSHEMQALRSLTFAAPRKRDSPIREVARLEKAVTLLQNSLKSFAAFVPIGVVRRLVVSGKPLTQEVESKELTVLFTDVVDFTAISEKLPPKELSEQLTGYFEEASRAIRTEGGTIDKFIGDAVMAFWGAPAPIANQVERACTAALKIAARMRALNSWASAERPALKVRIGLHHGKALVGNIGSSDRLSYTAIGDVVNVASRLEAINKKYGTTICISGAVYEEVKDKIVARRLEVVKVRGREQELPIYELLGMKDARDPELRAPDSQAA